MVFPTLFVEQTPVWKNYLDLANDVKPWMQIPPTDTTRDVEIQELIDAACWWVQDHLARPIAPYTFARRFTGWTNFNGAYIMLPYFPVLQVVSVTEWWGANGPNPLTQQIPENQAGSAQTYQLDALGGKLIRSFMGLQPRPWFPGLSNVEVEWVAGYNPVPPTIRLATRELIKYWWVNTQQASRSQPMPRGEYGMDNPSGLWPGIPNKVAEWLQPFYQQGIG